MLKLRVDALAREHEKNFIRLSAGMGTKGERLYEWLRIERNEFRTPDGYKYYLMVRRSISDPKELAYYTCFVNSDATIQQIVEVAGSRWSIEECFEMAKGETGLDEYEVRTYQGWNRHILMSLWALFILVAIKQRIQDPDEGKKEAKENNEINTDENEFPIEENPSPPQPKKTSMGEYKKKQKNLSQSRFKLSVA
jgi:hypothetical protein